MPKQTALQDLVALANLITASVDAIVKACGDKPFPSLDDPFTPESEAARMSPEVQKRSTVLLAAATQLVAAVRSPFTTINTHAMSVRFRKQIDY